MAKKIKVLHIIKSLGRGGAEMLLPETLKLHAQEEFEFHYIYFLPWKNQLVEAIQQAGGIVFCFKASNNIGILLQYKNVLQYIRSQQIDVVHCHLPWAGFLGRLIHRFNSDIPVLYSEHNKQERYHGITFKLNKLTFNWQNAAIAVSDDVKNSIIKNIAPKTLVQTVLNGVNTESFTRNNESGFLIRKNHGIPVDAYVIGTIAVFRFQKRLLEWLEIARQILDQQPNTYFILVGDGPLKEEIYKKRKELQLENSVIMAGLQTDVKPWLSAMDVYMMSSIFEGLPIALLEAMSMECAVITTDAGGIKEVIRHGEDGLIVPTERWKSLSDEALIMNDVGVRKKFSAAARSRVETKFSLKVMVKQLENLYTINAK